MDEDYNSGSDSERGSGGSTPVQDEHDEDDEFEPSDANKSEERSLEVTTEYSRDQTEVSDAEEEEGENNDWQKEVESTQSHQAIDALEGEPVSDGEIEEEPEPQFSDPEEDDEGGTDDEDVGHLDADSIPDADSILDGGAVPAEDLEAISQEGEEEEQGEVESDVEQRSDGALDAARDSEEEGDEDQEQIRSFTPIPEEEEENEESQQAVEEEELNQEESEDNIMEETPASPAMGPDSPVYDPESAGMDPASPGVEPASPGMGPVSPEMDPASPEEEEAASPAMDPASPVYDPESPGMDPASPGVELASPGMGPASPEMDPVSPEEEEPASPGMDPASPVMDTASPEMDQKSTGMDPASPGVEPASPGVEPASPGVEPASPGVEPASPGVEPVSPGVEPVSPGVEPVSPGVEPASPGSEPASPGVEPASPGVEPASPGVEPASPGVEPASPGVEPASPEVEPSSPGMDPPSPTMDPGSPVMDPVSPDADSAYSPVQVPDENSNEDKIVEERSGDEQGLEAVGSGDERMVGAAGSDAEEAGNEEITEDQEQVARSPTQNSDVEESNQHEESRVSGGGDAQGSDEENEVEQEGASIDLLRGKGDLYDAEEDSDDEGSKRPRDEDAGYTAEAEEEDGDERQAQDDTPASPFLDQDEVDDDDEAPIKSAEKKDHESGGEEEPEEDEEKELIADIFGSSDEEDEEFEGFGENELEPAAKKQKTVLSSDDDDDAADDLPTGQNEEEVDESLQEHVEGEGAPIGEADGDSDSDEGVSRPSDRPDFVNDFETMMDRKKQERGHFRRKRDVDLINDNDDIIMAMITQMKDAAEEDRASNQQNQPALRKLKMFPLITKQLKKADIQQTLLECGILSAMKEWLMPLPDGSLPHISIRSEFLRILKAFPPVTQEMLRNSGIGKAVMILYRHPKETRQNGDVAGKIVNMWSRPIFGVDDSFLSLSKEERQHRDLAKLSAVKRRRVSSQDEDRPRTIEHAIQSEDQRLKPGDKGWIVRARVPMPSNKDYLVRPKISAELEMAGRTLNFKKKPTTKLDKRLKQIQKTKSKNMRAVSISLSGSKMKL